MILWAKWVYSLAITIEEKLSFKIYFLNFYIWSPYLRAIKSTSTLRRLQNYELSPIYLIEKYFIINMETILCLTF